VHTIILTLKLFWGFVGVSRNSVPIPSVSTSALSHGAFLGVSGNVRYQLLNGAERVMQQHFNHLGVVLFCSTALRFVVTSITLIMHSLLIRGLCQYWLARVSNNLRSNLFIKI
jgi:hypothetical protein